LFKERDEVLVKRRQMFNSEQIRIITSIKGNLILISVVSFFINSTRYRGLHLFIIHKNHREAVFEAPLEIAVATVENAIDAGFEEK